MCGILHSKKFQILLYIPLCAHPEHVEGFLRALEETLQHVQGERGEEMMGLKKWRANMKIAIGADHRGFLHKEFIKKHMPTIEWIDVGTESEERTDYPLFSDKVVDLIVTYAVEYGVLICGTGGGMAIAANRYKNMYAVVAWNKEVAQRCKQEDNANILVLPSDFIAYDDSVTIVNAWLEQDFKGGRYAERIAMIG